MPLLKDVSLTVPHKLLSLLPPHVGGHEIAAAQPDLLPLVLALVGLYVFGMTGAASHLPRGYRRSE